MPEPQLAAAFRAHVERASLDNVAVVLRDPWTVAGLLKDNTEPMPASLCVLLRVPPHSIYANGAREIKARIMAEARSDDDRKRDKP
ncbi:MAG TPA: hypothetical protein VGV12_14125 [Gemmatimonadales bacterium]|nr:hypothetical protein [Gemmatimonadales bacterium]